MTQMPLPPPPQTQPVTWLARLTSPIAGVCLSAFMLLGMVTTIYSVATGKLDLLPKPPTWASFLDGRVTLGIADALANAPVPRESATLERGLSWMAIGDLGARVRQGCNNWLFLSDELRPHASAEANAKARIQDVLRVQKQLAAQSASLLVVVIPDKSRMESAHLCGLYRPAAFNSRLADWVGMLTSAGVDVMNLQTALIETPPAELREDNGPGAFYRTDTHWNERGARSAAQAIASKVVSLGITPIPSVHYRLQPQLAEPRPGDLVRLAGIDKLPLSRQPRTDLQQPTLFITKEAPEGAGAAQTEEDLFGDAKTPNIAVIGTSYSRTSNFVPWLQAALNTRLVNAALDGGDFSGSARQYFQSSAFKETPPALVIWEIPERVLQMPRAGDDIGWK